MAMKKDFLYEKTPRKLERMSEKHSQPVTSAMEYTINASVVHTKRGTIANGRPGACIASVELCVFGI